MCVMSSRRAKLGKHIARPKLFRNEMPFFGRGLFCFLVQRGGFWVEVSFPLWSRSCHPPQERNKMPALLSHCVCKNFALALVSPNCAFGIPCFVPSCRRCSVIHFPSFAKVGKSNTLPKSAISRKFCPTQSTFAEHGFLIGTHFLETDVNQKS